MVALEHAAQRATGVSTEAPFARGARRPTFWTTDWAILAATSTCVASGSSTSHSLVDTHQEVQVWSAIYSNREGPRGRLAFYFESQGEVMPRALACRLRPSDGQPASGSCRREHRLRQRSSWTDQGRCSGRHRFRFDRHRRGGRTTRGATGSGTIEIAGARSMVRARTGSGGIRIEGQPLDAWDLQTGSGSINMRVIGETSFDLDARSGSGGIESTQPVNTVGASSRRRCMEPCVAAELRFSL